MFRDHHGSTHCPQERRPRGRPDPTEERPARSRTPETFPGYLSDRVA